MRMGEESRVGCGECGKQECEGEQWGEKEGRIGRERLGGRVRWEGGGMERA